MLPPPFKTTEVIYNYERYTKNTIGYITFYNPYSGLSLVTERGTEPQNIETTNVIATLYSKARASTVTGYKFTALFSDKKVHCSQVSNGNTNRLDHESFYQNNI